MFRYYNPNPAGRNVGDCTVRALSRALDLDWDQAYMAICAQGFAMKDMPSANSVWGAYLRGRGFRRRMLPDGCPDCYTVADFAGEHPRGVHILALSGHVVCVENGIICDTWDSGNEIPIYHWTKE